MVDSLVAPQLIVRCLGPCGPRLTRRLIGRRFAYLRDEECDLVAAHVFHTLVADASGEIAFIRLFDLFGSPFLVAKRPLLDTLPTLRSVLKILALYGDEDWMDRRDMVRLANERLVVEILPKCGHQMYLENPPAFNDAVAAFCELVDRTASLVQIIL